MANKNESENDIYPVLCNILRWARVAAISLIASRIDQELALEPQKLLVYHLSDGENSSRDIASIVKSVSHMTVTNYWKNWARIGIVEPSPSRKGRWRKIIELEELGIDVPKSSEVADMPPESPETPRTAQSSDTKN